MILDNENLKYSTPEEQGISSESLLDFFETVQINNAGNAVDLHSFQVIRHDRIIAEGAGKPFSLNNFHRIYSSAKGIIALGVMIAVQEGKVGLDEKVIDIFSDKLPKSLSEKMKRVTVYHLLTMSCGQDVDSCVEMFQSDNWIKTFLSIDPVYEPGSRFFYNNGIPHVLAAIVEKKTGEDILSYMEPRLLEPMGVKVLCRYNKQKEREPSTVCVRQTDLTKFGYLLLKRGIWNGKQLISPELCDEFGKFHISTANHPKIFRNFGYGYQVWKMPCEGFVLAGGNDNHSCVFTEADMVFSCMANNKIKGDFSIQKTFYDLVYLKMSGRPLPANPQAYERLKNRLEQWNLAPCGSDESGLEEEIGGRTFTFEQNSFGCETIRFEFDRVRQEVEIITSEHGTVHRLRCGMAGKWPLSGDYIVIPPNLTHGNFIDGENQTEHMAGGAWTDRNRLLVFGRSLGRVASDQFDFRFDEDGLHLYIKTPALAIPGCAVDKKKGEFHLTAVLDEQC
ncbi:serine hydrolase [Clostridium sp. MCC353]|uniref:serine hydrolase domain-containing protein n=1 Tax=Clostridium sp. MCC353 TaxID=2592646 RepID=UPI001C018836|nr:serine hydrolase [Clostridium sp. MCC353]